MTIKIALDLAEKSEFYVFPVKHGDDNTKTPLTPHGHKDASRDPNVITDWWEKFPEAKVGVACGKSGITVADIDTKNGKDGWTSLDEAWLDLGEPYSYETSTGGSHLVYRAPEDLNLAPHVNYRGMAGVDVRAGESWVLWAGGVPTREELNEAPKWLLDEKEARQEHNYSGTVADWFSGLTPGEPNALVRRAWEKAAQRFEDLGNDFSHSDLIELQFEAIRLGAEGNSGIPQYLEFLEDLFLSRTGAHSRSEEDWPHEWQEGLLSGLEKYGETISLLKNLPEYSIGLVPKGIPDTLITTPTDKAGFSKLLGALIKETEDDNRILSILWNCPATKDLSREWGLEFTFKRIQDARVRPEPTRENPRIEEKREAEKTHPDLISASLLTEEERRSVESRPGFVESYIEASKKGGFTNEFYARASAWNVASLAFAFHGFIPQDENDNMGLNLWTIQLGESGTGKTRATKVETAVLNVLFGGEEREDGIPRFDLGAGSSPEGVHEALLLRDRKASMFYQDEASEFFSKLKPSSGKGWMSGFPDALSRYYEGFVPGEQKVRLQQLRGKTALTHFNLHMFATPKRFLGLIERDMFGTGFVPRINWIIAPPPVVTPDRFKSRRVSRGKETEFGGTSDTLTAVAVDLIAARAFTKGTPRPIFASEEAYTRMDKAHEQMYAVGSKRENWDVIEPVVTRLAETLKKCAAICAMYRSDDEIQVEDVLRALVAVEEWFENSFQVASLVSEGDFQRACRDIEEWVKGRKGGKASRAEIYHTFRNLIERDSRELDGYLTYLLESGSLNRKEENGTVKYEVNGVA